MEDPLINEPLIVSRLVKCIEETTPSAEKDMPLPRGGLSSKAAEFDFLGVERRKAIDFRLPKARKGLLGDGFLSKLELAKAMLYNSRNSTQLAQKLSTKYMLDVV